MQGFDKYGIWKQAAHPSPNLQKELGLKVRTCGQASTHDLQLVGRFALEWFKQLQAITGNLGFLEFR